MSPSTADFSEILELQQFRRLYEEQEEKTKVRMTDKQEEIGSLETVIGEKEQEIQQLNGRVQELGQQMEKMRGDYNRLRQEAQEKIDKLMERIKELNQRLVSEGGGGKSGIFR